MISLGKITKSSAINLCLLALGWGCHRPPDDREKQLPEVQLWGVHMDSFRGSERVALGTASTVWYERDNTDVTGEQPTLTLLKKPAHARDPGLPGAPLPAPGMSPWATPWALPPSAEPAAELVAPHMVGNLTTHAVDAFGGIRGHSEKGLSGATDRAHFDAPSQLATGQGPIHFAGPGYALDAYAFTLDFRDEVYDFHGPVSSVVGTGEAAR